MKRAKRNAAATVDTESTPASKLNADGTMTETTPESTAKVPRKRKHTATDGPVDGAKTVSAEQQEPVKKRGRKSNKDQEVTPAAESQGATSRTDVPGEAAASTIP